MTESNGQTTESASSAKKTDAVRKLHFILQGKGGVGKTISALLLSQAITDKGDPVTCIDTDPVNSSFSNLSSLPVDRMSIFNGNKVDTRALDQLTERMVTENADFVIDNGASSFVPMSLYLLENGVLDLMVEEGRLPVVHVVITGGPGMLDTMKGLSSVLEDYPPTVRIVVWLNEFFGPVANASGKGFEDLPIYTENRERIFAIIRLSQFSDVATSDLRDMISKKMTFAQALEKKNTGMLLMQKSRLFRMRQALWPQIEMVI